MFLNRETSAEFRFAFDIEHTRYRARCDTSVRMNKGESERIQELCSRIAVEQDRNKFLKLCEELNHLLSVRSRAGQEGKHGGAEGT